MFDRDWDVDEVGLQLILTAKSRFEHLPVRLALSITTQPEYFLSGSQ
jgi:hypothetical protein